LSSSTTIDPLDLTIDSDLFRILVESVRDYAIFLLTPDGRVASWNAGAEAIKGYTAKEIIGQHISRFYPPDAVARDWPNDELRFACERGRFEDENWRVRKDGSLFWANVIITALYNPDGSVRGYAKITRDLTERLRNEESLRSSEERLRLLIDGASDHAIFMLDIDGYIASWNAGAQRLKGYTRDDVIGQHFSKFYLPEAVERKWPEHELRVAREVGRFEDIGWRIRKDGSRFWANVIINTLYDSKRRPLGFVKITRDLTEKNQVVAMQNSEKHMNEFLATLGHELRNPLGAISNAAKIVMKMGQSSAMQQAGAVLERQTKLMGRLVDDLLDVARIRQGKLVLRNETLVLQTVLEHAVESVPFIAQQSQSLAMQLPSETLRVIGDSHRLLQAFINIITNASKYTPAHGSINVSCERGEGEAIVRIRDSGQGIDPELLPNIFDLFRQGERTLHDARGGLGIGLTIVHRILQLHGGTIEAYSAGRDKGSEFIVRLPFSPPAAARTDDGQ
jgi:PAS domain S-box-containing protein